MKKEEIYVNLQGKTKEELTDLWEFLDNAGEGQTDLLEEFLKDYNNWGYLALQTGDWTLCYEDYIKELTEVTIEQLKQIIKPTLQQQLQKAEAEVKRLQSLIEEENKPKIGDWAMLWEEDEKTPVFGLITNVTDYFLTCNGSWEYAKKITNPELIKLLENECSTKN